MKNIARLTILITALSAIFAACEKTDTTINTENNGGGESTIKKERVIIYSVGNSESRQTLTTEAEWDGMLERLCDQAQGGNEVTFYNISQATLSQAGGAKDNRTISTDSRDEVKAWMKEMEKQGLTVHISYDDNTGRWHGEAYATMPSSTTSYTIIGTWHFTSMVVSQLDADGNIVSSDILEPDSTGGSMFYTFANNGTLTLTINSMTGVTATDNGVWTLSTDGVLSSGLMPNGIDWNVNWITSNTMILSRYGLGNENDSLYYQLMFDAVANGK